MNADPETEAMVEQGLGVNQRKSGVNVKMILALLAVAVVAVVVVVVVVISGGDDETAAEVEAAKVMTGSTTMKVDVAGLTDDEIDELINTLGVDSDQVSYVVASTTVATSIAVTVDDEAVLNPESDAYADFATEFESSVATSLEISQDTVTVTNITATSSARRSLKANVG